MVGELLPLGTDTYVRSNEQQTRRAIETKLEDNDRRLSSLLTTRGTLALGETAVTLINGSNDNVALGYTTYSQISGPSAAFSVTKQAIQLGILPRMQVRHTSVKDTGQIYVPFVNWGLFVFIVLAVGLFKSSSNLASAYGIAVTGTINVLGDTDWYSLNLIGGVQYRFDPPLVGSINTAMNVACVTTGTATKLYKNSG